MVSLNQSLEMEVPSIKKVRLPILLLLLSVLMGGSYFILRLNNIGNITVPLITIALFILPSITIYWLLIRPGSMTKLLVYPALIVCLGASYFIIHASQKGFFNQVLVWLLPVLEISIVIAVLYSIIKGIVHYKKANKSKGFLEIVGMSLEPRLGDGFVLGAILTELNVAYYSIFSFTKKAAVSNNETAYFYHKTSQIKTFVTVFSILIVLEGILFHFVIQLWSDIAAWIFTILNIYALLYITGLYHSVRLLPHMIQSDKLIIRLGYQSNIKLDISNIESIKNTKKKGGIGEKIPKETYFAMLNLDSPQYEILLRVPALMRGSYGRKKYVKTIVFRTDEPHKMIAELNAAIASFSKED